MATDGHADPGGRAAVYSADLCRLLEKGLSLARAGHWAHLEHVASQMETVVASLAEADGVGTPISGPQRERLEQLYGQLKIVVESQRQETRARLKKLRGVRRAVGVYGGGVR